MTLTLPTIHINGTSAEQLMEGYLDALHHVREAIAAIGRCAPNGRDYYPQGPAVIIAAQREHRLRVEKLEEVMHEIEAIAEHVSDLAAA